MKLAKVTLYSILLVALTGCGDGGELKPFVSDGCSLFPDRAYLVDVDWCSCCYAHDLAYWSGGNAEERTAADQIFRECVAGATGGGAFASFMYYGVRLGGSAYFPTSFRWGYGWDYGRGYKGLTDREQGRLDVEREKISNMASTSICEQ